MAITSGICKCDVCEGKFLGEIIKRGNDEYIILNGKLLTYYGAPVKGNEDALYYLHEDIARADELGMDYSAHLWPAMAGVFGPDDLVDLYRLLKRERAGA